MKSNARRQVGIVLGMLLALVLTTRAQERTAFVCEGRIGNAATSPDAALRGDFEYDIGTNTAAPYRTGQYAWPTGSAMGTPVPFEILYTNRTAYFRLGTDTAGWLTYPLAADVFTATNGVGTLNLRARTVQPGSTVRLQNLTVQLAGDPNTYDLDVLEANNNASVTTNYPVAGLPAGFYITGNAIFTWSTNNVPGRSQSAFQMAFTEWKVNVRGDTNRDGGVDEADEEGKSQWTVARGAFVPVNQWATNAPPVLAANTIAQLAPLVIRKTGNLPAGWSVVLQKSNNTKIAILAANAGDLVGGSVDALETNVSVTALATGPVSLYVAATQDLGGFANKQDSVAFVRLSLRDENGAERASDTVALQVTPIILSWNSLPLERLYCTPEFPLSVANGRQAPYASAAVWVQDYMELGESSIATGLSLNQVMDLQWIRTDWLGNVHATGPSYITNLLTESSTVGLPVWHKATWPNNGNGGNIEVFPRYTSTAGTYFPFGRAVMASHATGAFGPIQAQGLQEPMILPLDWLAVGHIDEVFSFLNDSEVLVADPSLGWQEIINMVNESSADREIRVGTEVTDTYSNALQNVTNNTNFFFSQTFPVEQTIGIIDTTIEVTQGTNSVGDYLLINREVMRVTNITHTATNRVLWVARRQPYGSVNTQHGTAAKIRTLSDSLVRNVYTNLNAGADVSPVVKRLEQLRENLKTELGKTVTFRSVPVVFAFVGVNSSGGQMFLAATANMVNCVVDGNTIYATNPGNERFRQLFHNTVNHTVHFAQEDTPDDITAWDNYHIRAGELHCGSNGKRTLPPEPWWTFTEFTTWGGTSP